MRLFTDECGYTHPIKVIVWVLFMLFPISFGGCYGCSHIKSGEGYKDGIIYHLSTEGVFVKTEQGSMICEGMQFADGKGGGASGNRFSFTIKDPALLAKIKAIPHGKRVRLYYTQQTSAWFPKGESSCFVTDVEELK